MPHECTNCGRVFPDGSKQMLSGCPDCGGNKFQFRPSSQESESGMQSDPQRSDPDRDSQPQSDTHSAANHQNESKINTNTQPSPSNTDPVPKPDTTEYDGVGAGSSPEHKRTTNTSTDNEHTNQSDSDSQFDPWPHADPNQGNEENDDNTDPISTPHHADHPTPDTTTSAEDSKLHNPSEKDDENNAQASARGDIVSPEELAAMGASSDAEGHPQREVQSHSESLDSSSKDPSQTSTGDSQSSSESSTDTDDPGLDDLRTELNQQFESIRIVAPGQYELNLMELYDRSEYIISLQEDGRYVIEVPNAGRELSDDTN
ncbi:OapC/ArvC family zinc-ribbon domain-containing protein [Haloquadratum walsbyi]|uniref:OapC/ArvC family zinc-ribbon domain-containing protein n=1 Tax=Haloquadratum walsbyi TaxID=293091 RepID=UPI0015F73A9D|nr:Zn-ribbon containing protein [Haloquadratum walsbyi]